MKKILYISLLAGFLAMPLLGLAQTPSDLPVAPIVVRSAGDLVDLINRIGNIIFAVLLAISAVFLIISGIFFVTAAGNPEQVNKARQMLINALIGLGVALGARGMVAVIQSILPSVTT